MAVKQPAYAADSQHRPTADEGHGSRRLLGWDGIQPLPGQPGHHQASAETRSGGLAPTETRAWAPAGKHATDFSPGKIRVLHPVGWGLG